MIRKLRITCDVDGGRWHAKTLINWMLHAVIPASWKNISNVTIEEIKKDKKGNNDTTG